MRDTLRHEIRKIEMKCKSCARDIPAGSAYCNWCGSRQIKPPKNEIRIPKPRQLPSGAWFVQLRLGGESIPVTEDTEALCRARATAIKAGFLEAKKKPEPVTLEAAMEKYISSRENILSPCTIRVYKSIQKNHFQSLMSKNVYELTRADIQDAVNEEAVSSGPKTIKNACGLLRAVVSDYTPLDLSRVTFPQKESKERVVLSKDQLKSLFKAVEGTDIEVQVMLAAWLGLRRSEILALSWNSIDEKENTISITSAMVPGTGGMEIKGTKTEKSRRVLHADKFLIDKITALPKKGELIFTSSATTMTNHLKDACERAGIPNIGLHALRHTNASVMLALNVPDKYAMERGGWSSSDTMKYIYQHTMTDEKEGVNKAVDRYFKELITPQNANKSLTPG